MYLGSIFREAPPEHLESWLEGELRPGESIVGLRKTSTDDPATESAQWLLVTSHRNALVSIDDDGKTSFRTLPNEAPVAVDTSLTRISWCVGDATFDAVRLRAGALEELVAIAFETRAKMLFLAADAHVKKKRWKEADELLAACHRALEDSDAFSAPGHFEPVEEILLRRSVLRARLDDHDATVDLLADLSSRRPDDDLVEAGKRVDPPDHWWLTLALAHEEAEDNRGAANVYNYLHGIEADDVFLIARARNLRDAGEIDDALAAYDTFIAGRAEDDFRLVAAQAEEAAELDEASDLGTATALFESARMLDDAGRRTEAFDRWVEAVRFAPYSADSFRGLIAAANQLDQEARAERAFLLRQSAELLRIVLPRLAEELAASGNLPEGESSRPWETGFEPLDDDLHDNVVVHPGERDAGSMAQRWTAALLKDERDTDDIVRHAQPADTGAHPVVDAVMESVSKLLGVTKPRVFLSHGSTGVDVLGADKPFILLGAAHLDSSSPVGLSDPEIAFALASQMEHIRAGHLLLTSSEFWKTFGTISMTAVLAFVPMGDLIGKFTDGAVLRWLGKLQNAPSNAVSKMVQIAEERVKEGAGRSTVQSAYAATLGKLRQVGLASTEKEEAHMVKERLADFARCARYTADRVGLLATDDLSDSVAAILRLSPSFGAETDDALREGLAAVLSERGPKGKLVHGELTLRLGELFKFAMSDSYRDLRDKLVRT